MVVVIEGKGPGFRLIDEIHERVAALTVNP
jgi:hypothetical protein